MIREPKQENDGVMEFVNSLNPHKGKKLMCGRSRGAWFLMIVLQMAQIVALLVCVALLFYFNTSQRPNKTVCQSDTENVRKREVVKAMMKAAWREYNATSWDSATVCPVTSRPCQVKYFGHSSGLSAVAALTTLWTMNLTNEFQRTRDWLNNNSLHLELITEQVGLLDLVTDYVGPLLSTYALTNDSLFLAKALDIAKLVPGSAFDSVTGIPAQTISPLLQTSDGFPSLSQVGGFVLEYRYLSVVSDDKFGKQIDKMQNTMARMHGSQSVPRIWLNQNATWRSNWSDLFADTRHYYTGLIKSVVQSDLNDQRSLRQYNKALKAAKTAEMFLVLNDNKNLTLVRRYYNCTECSTEERYYDRMRYEGCYLAGMLITSIDVVLKLHNRARRNRIGQQYKLDQPEDDQYRYAPYFEFVEGIANACHWASISTRTGLGPEEFAYNSKSKSLFGSGAYELSSELAESNFLLWRRTKDPKYRDRAWEMVTAIRRHCQLEKDDPEDEPRGFSSISNVDQVPPGFADLQPPVFLSATLKFLYLTFSEDEFLPLHDWVFTDRGHPLPVCGRHHTYPQQLCSKVY